jgi:hypothetical protein
MCLYDRARKRNEGEGKKHIKRNGRKTETFTDSMIFHFFTHPFSCFVSTKESIGYYSARRTKVIHERLAHSSV